MTLSTDIIDVDIDVYDISTDIMDVESRKGPLTLFQADLYGAARMRAAVRGVCGVAAAETDEAEVTEGLESVK